MKAEKEDELLGNWYTEEESLGFSAVWCCQITFNAQGNEAILRYWAEQDHTLN